MEEEKKQLEDVSDITLNYKNQSDDQSIFEEESHKTSEYLFSSIGAEEDRPLYKLNDLESFNVN